MVKFEGPISHYYCIVWVGNIVSPVLTKDVLKFFMTFRSRKHLFIHVGHWELQTSCKLGDRFCLSESWTASKHLQLEIPVVSISFSIHTARVRSTSFKSSPTSKWPSLGVETQGVSPALSTQQKLLGFLLRKISEVFQVVSDNLSFSPPNPLGFHDPSWQTRIFFNWVGWVVKKPTN